MKGNGVRSCAQQYIAFVLERVGFNTTENTMFLEVFPEMFPWYRRYFITLGKLEVSARRTLQRSPWPSRELPALMKPHLLPSPVNQVLLLLELFPRWMSRRPKVTRTPGKLWWKPRWPSARPSRALRRSQQSRWNPRPFMSSDLSCSQTVRKRCNYNSYH